jgi:uncharacterized coiled-coil DUF342 family protein
LTPKVEKRQRQCLDCGGSLLEPGAPAICAAAHLPGAREYADQMRTERDALLREVKSWQGRATEALEQRDAFKKWADTLEATRDRLQVERDALEVRVERLLAQPHRCDDCPGGEDYKTERDALQVALKEEYDKRIALMWEHDALQAEKEDIGATIGFDYAEMRAERDAAVSLAVERLERLNAALEERDALKLRVTRLRKAVNWLRGANHDNPGHDPGPSSDCDVWECQRAKAVLDEETM